MKKSKFNRIIHKSNGDTVVIDRIELIKQLRRNNLRKGRVIQPKKGQYNRKDKSWKKEI
ncbi:MAG: hypothetical protein KKD38_07515 [Candidatus Delongbacteria bacterium]|nr:hypothetical protein [Candidatus Delongbacteria bacterium]MCG2759809.1 hypothetical protein [Candidatus Delongbacteria bacterium]